MDIMSQAMLGLVIAILFIVGVSYLANYINYKIENKNPKGKGEQ